MIRAFLKEKYKINPLTFINMEKEQQPPFSALFLYIKLRNRLFIVKFHHETNAMLCLL